MRTFPDVRMRKVINAVRRAQQQLDEGEYVEARDGFLEAKALSRKLGLTSAYVDWALAVVFDNLGELEMAFASICESVQHDPLNPAGQRSFDVIVGHLRASLADEQRDPADPSTPRLYALLMEAGEADVPSHLAMARHLSHAGRHDEALRVLDAVTLLSPVSRDAWRLKEAVAQAKGDLELAASCAAESAAIGNAEVPFGLRLRSGSASC